jgi:hypothetical protein
LPETQNWEMIPPQMGALEDVEQVFTDFQSLEKLRNYELNINDESYALQENLTFQTFLHKGY